MTLENIDFRLLQFKENYLSWYTQKLMDNYIVPENILRRRTPMYSFDQWLYSKQMLKLVDFGNKNIIPPMAHPLSKHWDQCDTTQILCDDTTATIKIEDFLKLREYSTSDPTGVYIGKCWRTKTYTGHWHIVFYSYHNIPGYCSKNFRKALIII